MLILQLRKESITFVGNDTLVIVRSFTPNAARVDICNIAEHTRSGMNIPMGCKVFARMNTIISPLRVTGETLHMRFDAPRDVRISLTPQRRISEAEMAAREMFA